MITHKSLDSMRQCCLLFVALNKISDDISLVLAGRASLMVSARLRIERSGFDRALAGSIALFLGETLNFHSASLQPGVSDELNPAMD